MKKSEYAVKVRERRQLVADALNEPRTIRDIAAELNISYWHARQDIRHLRKLGYVVITSKDIHNKKGNAVADKYLCRPVNLESLSDLKASEFKAENYPPILLKFLGHNAIDQKVSGRVFKTLDEKVRPEPLRKINAAWLGYQSGLEMA